MLLPKAVLAAKDDAAKELIGCLFLSTEALAEVDPASSRNPKTK
jgi:hypothetical protein